MQFITDDELPKLKEKHVHIEGFRKGAVFILEAYTLYGKGAKYLLRTPKTGRLIATSNRIYHTRRNEHAH